MIMSRGKWITYVQMSISEAEADVIRVACFDVNRWQPRPLIDSTIHSRFVSEDRELRFRT